jgi:ribosome biogenesis protein ERB1
VRFFDVAFAFVVDSGGKTGVPAVCFHPKLPLFASCSHDGSVHIFHGRVYDSYATDPLIVPVKILKVCQEQKSKIAVHHSCIEQGHEVVDQVGVLDIVFHKTQPWIFSCGADNTAKLWIDK